MNATTETNRITAEIVPLPIRRRVQQRESRFKIQEFTNPRTGSKSWRVSGSKRDGERVRENFKEEAGATCRQIELETEYLKGHAETEVKATKLSHGQLQLAEVAIIKMGDDWERLLDAVDHWKKTGRQTFVAESVQVDDAVEQFKTWMDSPECDLADHTKRGYQIRVGMFGNNIGRMTVAEVTPKAISGYLSKRAAATGPDKTSVGKTSLKNDKRAICRFLSWCVEKEWITVNPAIGPRRRTGAKRTGELPGIFTVDQCKKLLKAAEKHKKGMLVPYVAVCLFAGLRPDSEAERITWKQVNLTDGEITIEPWMTKTGIPRTIKISKTLSAWLNAYKGREFYPKNWRRHFDAVKKAAGITKWIVDGMRHTAHSHYFRECGSYGLTAEFFGNSEGIVRRNYVNRVTSEETEKFYALRPKRIGKAAQPQTPKPRRTK